MTITGEALIRWHKVGDREQKVTKRGREMAGSRRLCTEATEAGGGGNGAGNIT